MLQYQSRAVTSPISTKHKAVIAYAGNGALADKHKVACKKHFRMRTPDQHAAMLSYLNAVSWDCVLLENDTQMAFDHFYWAY